MAKPPMCEKSGQSYVSLRRLGKETQGGRARTVDARDEAQSESQDQLGNERKEHPARPREQLPVRDEVDQYCCVRAEDSARRAH